MVTRERRGVALVFVLWMLVLLGLAAAELVARARTESRIVATLRSRAIARYAAESGVLVTATALNTVFASAPGPLELAARTAHLDTLGRAPAGMTPTTARFAVAVVDLNARLDLARTDTATLHRLFNQFVPVERARRIVTALSQEPVTRFSELARVPGADAALALAVAPYVTVGSDGLVNVNSAPEAVLAALPGVGLAKAHALIARRDQGNPFTSTDPFRPAPGSQTVVPVEGSLLTIAPSRLMIVSRGWQLGSPLTHEIQAVYVALAGRLTLQSWEERDR